MSEDEMRADTGTTNEWHPLPGLIGDAIIGRADRVACGSYHVENDGGDVVVYRVIERAESVTELDAAEGSVFEGEDHSESLREIAVIPRPDTGWDSENNALPPDIWEGYR